MKPRSKRWLAAAVAGVGVLTLATVAWVLWPLPAGLTDPPAVPSLSLTDRHGLLLRSTRAADGSRARWLPLDQMDPQLLQAFIALEDRRFYAHHGVDPRAVARALLQDLAPGGARSGASTITMQLARLLHPVPRSVAGKVVQALWALRLERHLSKQAILEQYLNRVPLGQGASGVAAAAGLYFDASATRLSLGQAALLAGLARAPSADNPFVAPARAKARRATALARMQVLGFVTLDLAARANAEPLVVTHGAPPFLAPHFTSRVLAWTEDSVAPAPSGAWRTSLDLELQREIESEVRHTVDLFKDRGVRQGAVVVLDNRTGEILAWVGSPDFWADSSGQVDMVVSPRQPGSALKPFLYGLAFDRGYTAASLLADIPHTYRTSTGPYQPRNYDRRFHGPVRAREALASSFNVPAVELTDQLGAASLLHVLHQAGFDALRHSPEYYGLGLALGNGNVTLLELANAYRALENEGAWRPYRWDAVPPGGSAAPSAADERRVMTAGSAALVLDILSDPVARVPGFGIETPFDFPFPVAVKTGTSHHYTDNWAVGVTQGFTVAVWVGNFTGRPMHDVSGVTGAGPLLRRVVLDAARRYEPGVLPSPAAAGAERAAVCRLTGLKATPECPEVEEWFLPGTVPTRVCDWHDSAGGTAWPGEYRAWAEQNGLDRPAGPAPVTAAPAVIAATEFRILSPLDGDAYQIPPGIDPRYATIALRAAGAPADGVVQWWVDGAPAASSRWQLRPGAHAIRAVAASGRAAQVRIQVR